MRDSEGQKMSKSKGNDHRPFGCRRRHRPRRAAASAHHRPDAAAPRARDREGHAQGLSEEHRRLQHRRAALQFRVARDPRAPTSARPAARRGLSQLLQQAVERGPLHADDARGRRRPAAGRATADRSRRVQRRRSLDRLPARPDAGRRRRRVPRLSFRFRGDRAV
ncbi:MAG: hypothetical protein R3E65_11580 [Steroidobacteraceae bacterium]